MKKQILLASALALGMHASFAQSGRTISGTVLGKDGKPLIAADVKTQDDKAFAQTNENGEFTLEIPEGASSQIIIEYPDYAPAMVTALPGQSINYQFKESATDLEEVVVVGDYFRTTKAGSAGVIDGFSSDRIEKFPVTDITKAIEGSMPGIQVTNGGGQPGSSSGIQIRGRSSISASNSPLYVVDGAPYMGDITSINPADIERVSVLKDATAAALYGSRGANGVIVITTKRAKRSADAVPTITFETKMGVVSRGLPDYSVIKDPAEYYQMYWDGLRNQNQYARGQAPATAATNATNDLITELGGYNSFNVPDNEVVLPDGSLNPNLGAPKYLDDWNKELQRTGFRQDHILTVQGGSAKTDYYLSLGYLKEQGYIKFTDYERLTARLNLNTNITDWLRAGINVSGAYSQYNFAPDEGNLTPGYNPFLVTRSYAPIYPVYYRNANNEKEIDPITGGYKWDMGDKSTYPNSSIGTFPVVPNRNVLAALTLDRNHSQQFNMTIIPYIEFDFLKHFTFKTDVQANIFTNNGMLYRNMYYGQYSLRDGLISKSNGVDLGYNWKQMVSWRRTFNQKHNFDAVAAHEFQLQNSSSLSAARYGVANHKHPNLTGAAVAAGSSSSESFFRIESYLARAGYNYNYKYFLEASVRADGISRLHPDSRWGSFWAVAGAWNMKTEEFLKDVKWLDMLKLKASYGNSGNANFGNLYIYQRLYGLNITNGVHPGALSAQLGNRDLEWEKTAMANVGIDFAVKDYRVSGEINLFKKFTKDMYFNLPMAPSLGVSSRPVNLLDMETKGIEASLNIDIIRQAGGFNWNVNLNATSQTNVITKMPVGIDSVIDGIRMLKVGHSPDEFYTIEYGGVNRNDGSEIYYYNDADGVRRETSDPTLATAMGGRDYRGSSIPKFTGAFTNNFSYKNFGVSFTLTYGVGGDYFDQIYAFAMVANNPSLNLHTDLRNRWTPENPDTDIPRLEIGHQHMGSTSTRWMIDASFLNFRNFNMYYDLPTNLANRLKLQKIKVFASVDNVYIWTRRQGMDPQGAFSAIPSWNYPLSRVISGGLRITL